ncbi:non-functional NADPH-dependent codeinone reductase 2-like isoform X2 [Diospyros lotus]|uniref:non-functional NADPH-dependent codeinone reductase 2-like isoform X2 n=1 Tax=Diospyros lotus TaxID=55363 RepID=UPI00225377E6|nr:non-functional NADPH-dependent codeinone reductase 2-like isoform X2 [Diospyros lotus]
MEIISEAPLPDGNNGTIPVLGFGTAVWPLGGSETMQEAIVQAIKLGYRHFDTAAIYGSERCLGEAIAEALRLGLIQSRGELFVTSKLWCSEAHPGRVLPALRNSLDPVSLKAEAGLDTHFNKKDLVPMDFKRVWEGMEECYRLGLAKNIGVSNFSCKKLHHLLLTASIAPVVNQVEMNPLWQQAKLREFCREKGIHITAYSVLGGIGTAWGSSKVLDCEVLGEIAQAKGKTVAQVCLRWVYEQGVSMAVKSFNKHRLKENIGIFDWMLSPEDCRKIDQIPQQRIFPGDIYISDDGPFTSYEELWDGEASTRSKKMPPRCQPALNVDQHAEETNQLRQQIEALTAGLEAIRTQQEEFMATVLGHCREQAHRDQPRDGTADDEVRRPPRQQHQGFGVMAPSFESSTDDDEATINNPFAPLNPYWRDVRWGGADARRWDSGFKLDLPKFHGGLDPEDFLDWLVAIEELLDFKEVPEDKKVPLVATRLSGRAAAWRRQLKANRAR